VLGRFDVEGYPVAILEFIDGISLEDRLLSEVETPPELYRDIGAQLAAMHRITFSEAGFLGPRLTFGHEYVTLSPFLREFVERTLTMLLKRPERLNPDLNERLSRLVQDTWAMVNDTEPRRQLVHCDFNPKNLLVSRGAAPTLLAVLDWEFCLSGNGLGDLGNFFRFEYDYPDTARDAFIGGYRSVEPDLPANWFEVARLMDLASMCSFLERPEDYRESFHTARVVIEATLTHFGY
jgi:Ser/Thr protein kinase RdoA (MazF antagonist)